MHVSVAPLTPTLQLRKLMLQAQALSQSRSTSGLAKTTVSTLGSLLRINSRRPCPPTDPQSPGPPRKENRVSLCFHKFNPCYLDPQFQSTSRPHFLSPGHSRLSHPPLPSPLGGQNWTQSQGPLFPHLDSCWIQTHDLDLILIWPHSAKAKHGEGRAKIRGPSGAAAARTGVGARQKCRELRESHCLFASWSICCIWWYGYTRPDYVLWRRPFPRTTPQQESICPRLHKPMDPQNPPRQRERSDGGSWPSWSPRDWGTQNAHPLSSAWKLVSILEDLSSWNLPSLLSWGPHPRISGKNQSHGEGRQEKGSAWWWGQRGRPSKPLPGELPPYLESSQPKDSCQNLPETHRAQVFSVIGGTNHIPQHKGDNTGDVGLLAVNLVTLLVVHDKHLGLLQLWGQRGVGCGGVQWGENWLLIPLNPASSQGLSLQHQDLATALHVSRPSFTWPFPCGVDHVWQAPNSLKLFSKILFSGNLLLLNQAGYNTSFSVTTPKLRPQHHAASLQPLTFVLAVPSATWLTLIPPSGTSGRPSAQSSSQTPPDLLSWSPDKVSASFLVSLCPYPHSSYEFPRGRTYILSAKGLACGRCLNIDICQVNE